MSNFDERREAEIRRLIRKYGGVAGVARKIIFQHNHTFTPGFIRWKILRRHPLLEPAPGQIEEVIESLTKRGRVEPVKQRYGTVFRRAARRPVPRQVVKEKQMKFEFFNAVRS